MCDGIHIKIVPTISISELISKVNSVYTKIDFQKEIGVWGKAPFVEVRVVGPLNRLFE